MTSRRNTIQKDLVRNAVCEMKIVIVLIIIKAAKLSSFYLNNYFTLRSNTYSESEDKSDLNEYPSLSNSWISTGFSILFSAMNLYEYWGELLYRSVKDDSRIIINLASKEYSKCIEKYLTPQDRYITIVFCELSGDKLVTKGTYAKMARGEMVRFIAENNIENPVEIQEFDRLGYSFRSDLSSDSEYVFERKIK